jgi:acetylornithine deacetylase/succinyl-diaminopimelate desuccinylase-like protein
LILILSLILPLGLSAQPDWYARIDAVLPQVLQTHREFVSLPNVASDTANMQRNFAWAEAAFAERGFTTRLLPAPTYPVFLAELAVDPAAPTILYYLHLDGQAVNPARWYQPDPFVPVLKAQNAAGDWEIIDWSRIDSGPIDPEWRVFGRAAADDKAPIMMLLTALDLLAEAGQQPRHNVKVILDPEEEASSTAFLSTLEQYRADYAADYLLILDGPAHPSNRPTLTFGCRGIATCSITTYGAKLPQHSGHYGNYAPNPVFALADLLSGMKDERGRVTIDGYYDGIEIDAETRALFAAMPDDEEATRRGLVIARPDAVGATYQEALQYPSLNVRHIETSWKGPGLKTVIPEFATAHLDVRLVKETDGAEQLAKIRRHIEQQGYLVLDREPTDAERLAHPKIVTFRGDPGVNAFRTPVDAPIAKQLSAALAEAFGAPPIRIPTMGGTVPIIEAVNVLDIPAVIVPMVNMDNNQHNPNENIRIGNLRDGVRMCLAILGE